MTFAIQACSCQYKVNEPLAPRLDGSMWPGRPSHQTLTAGCGAVHPLPTLATNSTGTSCTRAQRALHTQQACEQHLSHATLQGLTMQCGCTQRTPCALTLKSDRCLAADLPHTQRHWTVICERNSAPLFGCLLLDVRCNVIICCVGCGEQRCQPLQGVHRQLVHPHR